MASLVNELARMASDLNSNVYELLLKAKTVASKLEVKDFKEWCDKELNGYNHEDLFPVFRSLDSTVMVEVKISTVKSFDRDTDTVAKTISGKVGMSVTKLKETLNSCGDTVIVLKNGNYFPDKPIEIDGGYRCDRSCLGDILAGVRNHVLDWALRLEEEGIDSNDNDIFSSEDKVKAQSVTNNIYNINGNHTQFAAGNTNTDISQKMKVSINKNDLEKFASFLKDDVGIPESDIQGLKNEIQKVIPTDKDKLENIFQSWLGALVLNGVLMTLKTGTDKAVPLILEAWNRYIG